MQVGEIQKSLTRRPKIQLIDPKRWEFEVFYRVISLSQDMGGSMRLSKLLQRVWIVLGHKLSVEKFKTGSCRLLETFYLNFICILMNLIILIGVC